MVFKMQYNYSKITVVLFQNFKNQQELQVFNKNKIAIKSK